MTITPGTAWSPEQGNETLSITCCASPNVNKGVLARKRSRSKCMAFACAMTGGVGRRSAFCSNGVISGHAPWFFTARGRPVPNWFHWPVQSIPLNQSPELKLSLSSDFERSSSVPEAQKHAPWLKATVAFARTCNRKRC